MALACHWNSLALRSHSSRLCPPASRTLPGTPPASRGELAQSRLCVGSSPGAAPTPCPDVSFLGCSLAVSCWLPAPAGHSTRAGSEVAGRRGQLGQGKESTDGTSQPEPAFWDAVFVMAGSSLCPRQGCTHSLAEHSRCWRLHGTTGKMSSTVSC